MVPVHVHVGVGSWKAYAEVALVAAPHMGDVIEVLDRLVYCERVVIGEHAVKVEETRRFKSLDDAMSYFTLDESDT